MTNDSNKDLFAIVSVGLGVVTLCAWFLPICGCPLSIIGIILGVMGLEAPKQRTLAMVGIGLCAVTLVLALINAVVGVALSVSG